MIKQAPFLGHKFYIASRIIYSEKVEVESFSTTDNTYFDVLLSVGILGFVPFMIMLYSLTKKLVTQVTSSNNQEFKKIRLELLCTTIIIYFRSLTGPSFQILHWNLPLFIALIIIISVLEGHDKNTFFQLRKVNPQ